MSTQVAALKHKANETIESNPKSREKEKWATTIRKVILDQAKHGLEKVNGSETDQRDILGEGITRLINKSPAFSRPQHDTCDTEKPFQPLFCSENIQRMKQVLNAPLTTRQIRLALMKYGNQFYAWTVRDCQSWGIGLRILGSVLLCAVSTNVFIMQFTIVWTTQVAWCSAAALVSILIDADDLKMIVPEDLFYYWQETLEWFAWIDASLARGRQVAGREWNQSAYSFSGLRAESQNQSLYNCPPPKLETPEAWSRDSIDHVASINFCYRMLQNDQIGQQARKKRRVLNKAARDYGKRDYFIESKSRSLIELGDTLINDTPENDVFNDLVTCDTNISVDDVVDNKGDTKPDDELSKSSESSLDWNSFLQRDFDFGDDEVSRSAYLDDDETLGISFGKVTSLTKAASLKSDVDNDLKWVDVGTRIGLRLLNSEHVQRAVASQDTAERIMMITRNVKKYGTPREDDEEQKYFNEDTIIVPPSKQLELPHLTNVLTPVYMSIAEETTQARKKMPLPKPMHAMWTSAASVAQSPCRSVSNMNCDAAVSDFIIGDYHSPQVMRFPSKHNDNTSPPHSPDTATKKSKSSLKSGKILNKMVHHFSAKEGSVDTSENLLLLADGDHVLDSSGYRLECTAPGHEPIAVEVIQSKEGIVIDSIHGSIFDKLPARWGNKAEPEGFDSVNAVPSLCKHNEKRPLTSSDTSILPVTTTLSNPINQRPVLQAGVKIVLPIFPIHPGVKICNVSTSSFQMATVVSCKRINVSSNVTALQSSRRHTNCLSVTAILDKCFLRDGKFTEMTFRIMDDWMVQYVPRHSKFPIGACVATTFGVGILVGWRVEDDCHIVRSLWHRRGAGSADAYLNRHALHGVVEAAVGFGVQTTLGKGDVLGYIRAGREFKVGRYFVHIKEVGRYSGQIVEFNSCDILSCQGPEFIPVIELIREASQYQIQVDNYEAECRHQLHEDVSMDESKWKAVSKGFETVWSSFLLALEEDRDFDEGVNRFFTRVIEFLDRLDEPESSNRNSTQLPTETTLVVEPADIALVTSMGSDKSTLSTAAPGIWLLNSLFISRKKKQIDEPQFGEKATAELLKVDLSEAYKKANSIIRALMKTTSIARASSKDQPNLRLGLAIFYEFLLFLRTVVKVHQKNVSPISLATWKRIMNEISTTFGPIKERLEKVIKGIAERMERQGNKAKIRILRFADIVLMDEKFLQGLERFEWDLCIIRLENALVQSKIVDEESRIHYRMTLQYIIRLLSSSTYHDENAAARNNQKMVQLAKALKWIASPRRSVLKFLQSTYVMELLERVFVRVFKNEPVASRMITIHASNIHTLRQLRMLKDFTIAGKLWIPMLDAADEEFSWAVSTMPDNVKDVMVPLSKLFSLCVAQFHRIGSGDLTADWLNFLMQDDAVKLIHELDEKLILDLESFCKDIKQFMVVLPYYPSLDEDILNLLDEVDLDEFLREASEAFVDADKLAMFLREKTTLAIERFLDYLPRMSIPVERRDLGDGWVLTCRGENGGDLTLSDVCIKRENLICRVLGGESIFFPMFGDASNDSTDNESLASEHFALDIPRQVPSTTECTILDQIRELLLNAEMHGCWQSGTGGVGQQPTDQYVATVLQGIPVSNVLNCGIELWRSLEIDDDELLEITIRDVSYQIKLQYEREQVMALTPVTKPLHLSSSNKIAGIVKAPITLQPESPRHRFNPRVDPTVLSLEMNKLTLNLEKFHFRFEKDERQTIFDPIFEGYGSLCVQNVSILLRVECKKGRIMKMGTYVAVPVLQLHEFRIRLEKVKFSVKDTGVDWFLNRAVKQFEEKLTEIVEANLKEQVQLHIQVALENLNSHFSLNPDLLLGILGISIDDLEEGDIIWV